MTKKAPYKGLGADSEEKHEPASDIDTAMVVDGLKALDPKRPIREADIRDFFGFMRSRATPQSKPRCPFRHPDVYEICEAQMPDFEVVN